MFPKQYSVISRCQKDHYDDGPGDDYPARLCCAVYNTNSD